ncbi:CUE domain-containing protein 1-like [Gigantopelta aegis]|uniref:CUE domain-containing protein 1-like n=1 Tax=Gigantopelta aegis TaxID=1735272 RepID=UPI001B88DEE1|nr:CUE domain-containing protein 1-like [Gigantopelta aegis]
MMAMAETEKLNNESGRHSRRRDRDDIPSPNVATRPTKHLEFNQAMSDFKFMFPNMEEDVIEAVLRANNGIVDATIDQLLTMNVDSEEIPPDLQWIANIEDVDKAPNVEKDCSLHPIEDSPPPYSEAIQSPQLLMGAGACVQKTSPRSSPLEPAASHLLDMGIDELALSNTEPKTPVSPWSSPISSFRRYPHSVHTMSTKKPLYRNWNPPVLGTLPDDFLRLSPTSNPVKRTPSVGSYEKSHHRKSSSKSLIISTHDFSTDMLQEKMKENERRRKLASGDIDPELTQFLEDERLAIMFQNSEFLQELRDDEDFMNTLERDRMSTSAFEPKTPSTPEKEAMNEGYGTDRQDTLEAFPFSQQLPKSEDEDAELRRKLRHMGKASRKQFAALARRFFSRKKKKSSKHILKEKLAPSMMNLLDAETFEYQDEMPSDEHMNSRSDDSVPVSVSTTASYRTVQ